MSGEIRRSSRSNKGTHSARDESDVYYQYDVDTPVAKKQKVEEADLSEEGQVRCDGCGTTEENYDEETDEGGTMIECEKCKTWQHTKCMGYNSEQEIPETYLCNRCTYKRDYPSLALVDDAAYRPGKEGKGSEHASNTRPTANKKSGGGTKASAVNKTRESVTKALYNVIVKTDSSLTVANELAGKIESAIYAWATTADKKYIDKSRSVMALVKKAAVLERVATGDLSASDLASLPVEEIDPELKNYAEKVRQESIRRSVLTVIDGSSQRIRRTHKGEEIVETISQNNDEESNVGLIARKIDHRKFQDDDVSPDSKLTSPPITSSVSAPASNASANLYQLDDDDDEYGPPDASGHSENERSDSVSDTELDFILQNKAANAKSDTEKTQGPLKSAPQAKSEAPPLPATMPTEFWSGDIEFPDFASFDSQAEFISCTNYEKPRDITTVSSHNRVIRVCKELLSRGSYQIEGRLDRAKADPYLAKVISSRDLYLVKLNKGARTSGYSKVYDYLSARSKVGVLSNRAPAVKDAYVFALDHNAPPYMNFATVNEGLYILFVVKKDYVPVGKSILKKHSSPVQQPLRAPPPPPPPPSVSSLNSILSKLESSPSSRNDIAHLPQKPMQSAQMAQQNMRPLQTSAGLSDDQMGVLSEIVHQNPQVQNDPQGLLNLLRRMQA